MALANVSNHTPKHLHPVWKLKGAWEREWKREIWERERERERVKEDLKNEMEGREERKIRGTPRAHPAAMPSFRGKITGLCTESTLTCRWFDAYSEWQKRCKTIREREATSVHLRSQTTFQRKSSNRLVLWEYSDLSLVLMLITNGREEIGSLEKEKERNPQYTIGGHRIVIIASNWGGYFRLAFFWVVVLKWERSVGPVSRPQHNSYDHAAVLY